MFNRLNFKQTPMKMKNTIRQIEKNFEKSANFRNAQDFYNPASLQFVNAVDSNQVTQVQRMNPTASTITIRIQNTSAETKTVRILNPGDGSAPVFPAGVTVSVPQSSYTRLLSQANTQNFLIQGLRYTCLNTAQLSNSIKIGTISFTGQDSSAPYTALNMRSNLVNIETQIDDATFTMKVDSTSYLDIDVNGTNVVPTTGEIVNLIVTIVSMIKPGSVLTGKPEIAVNEVGFSSGLPQQTIVVQQAPPVRGISPQAPQMQPRTIAPGYFN